MIKLRFEEIWGKQHLKAAELSPTVWRHLIINKSVWKMENYSNV